MDRRRYHEDELKRIWKSWGEAKKTCFWDKIPLIGVLRSTKWIWYLLSRNTTLLHYEFRDSLKIYWKRNIDFLGPLANLMVLPVYTVKHFHQVFVPSTRPIEEFLEIEWPPNQSFEEWVQNLSTLTYQEIEWKAAWMGGSFDSGPKILEEIGRDTNQVGSNIELAIGNLFQPFPIGNVYPVASKKKKNLYVRVIQGK
ncbi:hypothetical protein Golob_021598 [Gossypium lobatum]|uniref:Uncharacterized protein n=1 Tax=Gossypium lobatum TaxID=34289 RepID=A0A7J8LE14_9ROSI|nr:hypothetical protein [Gossypium lobatum]